MFSQRLSESRVDNSLRHSLFVSICVPCCKGLGLAMRSAVADTSLISDFDSFIYLPYGLLTWPTPSCAALTSVLWLPALLHPLAWTRLCQWVQRLSDTVKSPFDVPDFDRLSYFLHRGCRRLLP